ncbi:3-hydroxyacyl-CoA dehydrogenase family protein [Devosia ginsengisoli]|uniref:L-gulonate 3-dehydrogenase n=1 Tax=Devosia ginsengisoli TaxID=400770 RepID=A0A5B8LVP2_9HYPH|nr:3-hydroxyacyl-CoA dehydrogenase family protein [Devosia ginsengisoli]QDZ11655.1 3-hydroxyacyl-CoA dehydrogenase family protein [Devosia ginsengisoli]
MSELRAAVLGSGTMGGQIALVLALGGADTVLWGRRPEALDAAGQTIEAAANWMVEAGLLDQPGADAGIARIRRSSDMADAVDGAGFVIEAVAEDAALKQAILLQAEQFALPETLLSSTTSGISATILQERLQHPERFAVAHFAQPAHLMRLVEVVAGDATSTETVAAVSAILERSGKLPVLAPNVPGFLWARIQHAILREFVSLVDRGLVTPEACDLVLKEGYAVRLPAMGSFEHADLAGLDLMASRASAAVWADLSTESQPGNTSVGRLLAEGKAGMRAGAGFYDWSKRNADAFRRNRDEEIVRRVLIQRGARVVPAGE